MHTFFFLAAANTSKNSGEVADDGELAFDARKIGRVFDEEGQREEQDRVRDYSPPVLFLSVDPTGEGSSKFALHTDYYRGNRQYVRPNFLCFVCVCVREWAVMCFFFCFLFDSACQYYSLGMELLVIYQASMAL